ncbi:hypothetical protein [Deinococcus aluminii]|uniref:Uncharacterized protein n=1 Tax=Deinococcus aluminii TaxID=1656885 RepID=A0ABP9XKC8_9DEIO
MTDDSQKKPYDPANTAPAEGQSHPIPPQDRGKAPNFDPANESPAEGQSHPIPPQDRGQNPGVDPAAKDQPAEGGRDDGLPGASTATTTRD